MVTETLELVVTTRGARAAGSSLSNIGTQAAGAAKNISAMRESLAFMRSTLVALSFLRAFEGVFEAVNQFQLMNNQDRKSTRLNSSHHSISYAVFCLKKK